MSLSVLGLIPARGNSRRVAHKNLTILGGKTLVRRALETALAAECFQTVALSSDSQEVLAQADGLPVTRIQRPAELATDTALTYDVVVHALEWAEGEGLGSFDAVGIVQCTSPFTAPEDLRGAVEMIEQTGAQSVVSVTQLEAAVHPLKLKRMEGDRLVPFLSDDRMLPSHKLPELWVRNGSIYLTRLETIRAGQIIADDVLGYRMPPERSHDIDTPTDLAFAEFLLSRELPQQRKEEREP